MTAISPTDANSYFTGFDVYVIRDYQKIRNRDIIFFDSLERSYSTIINKGSWLNKGKTALGGFSFCKKVIVF